VTPDGLTRAGLAALAVALAYLTWRFVERPVGHVFRRRPAAVALGLVALLAASGFVGSATRKADGYTGRFPPQVARIFNYVSSGTASKRLLPCFLVQDAAQRPLDEERRRVQTLFESHHCAEVADPKKPTIMIVGDSHAAHFFSGLEHEYGQRANVIALTAVYCMPLIENAPMDQGVGGTPRCHAINEYVFRKIREIKPDILFVGSYFASYAFDHDWRYANYFNDFLSNVHALHREGVENIVIAGQIPTWSPYLPILVGLEVYKGKTPPEFSAVGLQPDSAAVDAQLKAMDWGPGVTYVSQADSLCRDGACRRIIGPDLPTDMIAFDYGHYTYNGSIFAVKTIFAPTLDAILDKARKP
jgi:hypothetical protein